MHAVSAVQVKGNFLFDSANHRDFLGATMGCGIDRRAVGDIIVQGEQGAQILLVAELVQHLEMALTQVSITYHILCKQWRVTQSIQPRNWLYDAKQPV